jgi:hypothetical protein
MVGWLPWGKVGQKKECGVTPHSEIHQNCQLSQNTRQKAAWGDGLRR